VSGVLLVRHPPGRPAERAYALDMVLGEWLGIEFEARVQERADVAISLCEDPDGASVALPDALFSVDESVWLTEASLPRAPLERRPDGLPVVYGRGSALDVLGTVFFLLTRYEEIARPVRDEHERFPSTATLARAEGFLSRPLVDDCVEALWLELRARWPRLERREAPYGLALSHDVDWPLSQARSPAGVLRAMAGDAVRRGSPQLALRRARAYAARLRGDFDRDVANTFDFVMDAGERRGLRSAFYFMAGRTDPRWDGDYSLEDPWIAALLRRVDERGHEIGLHPSYGTFRDPEALRAEYDRLLAACEAAGVRQRPRGGRQHFLRWENPATWRAWEEAGLEYDASLGFSDVAGFRCGTAREYPVFDLRAGRRLRLRERPLVVMEQAVMGPGSAPEDVARAVAPLAAACRRAGGDLSLLWHNSSLISARERRAYLAALEAASPSAGAGA
jgi:hypothetical protein